MKFRKAAEYIGWGLAGFLLILAVLNIADAQDGLVPESEQEGVEFTTPRDIVGAAERMTAGYESYLDGEFDLGVDAARVSFAVGVMLGTMAGMSDNCLAIYERGIATDPWGDAAVKLSSIAVDDGLGNMWFTAVMVDFAFRCNEVGKDAEFMLDLLGEKI